MSTSTNSSSKTLVSESQSSQTMEDATGPSSGSRTATSVVARRNVRLVTPNVTYPSRTPSPPPKRRKPHLWNWRSSSNVARNIVHLFRDKDGTLRPFRLLKSDFCGRAKEYHTDWVFNQLILASAVYVFFTNLLPGITFASDLYVLTGENYGSIEVVFSTGLCGIIFALFSAQPLTILGVTGPFCILSERIYSLCHDNFHIDFLSFMAWACIHAAWMHWLLAIFNAHDWTMGYVTTFSTEIFSLLNSVIYFHKSIQELQRAHDNTSFASFIYSILGCVGTFLFAVTLSTANSWKVFHRYVRMGLAEYAAAISIIFFIGVPHIGELASLDQQRLPVPSSFTPTSPSRSKFFVEFWKLPGPWIAAAVVPGAIITTLFFFDVEVSTICATQRRYNIKKPGGYAWDVALLGTSTALCGILGIPPANGLLPQAPLHSESLLHDEPASTSASSSNSEEPTPQHAPKADFPRQTVHEQRWSHLLHAIGILAFVSPPLMHVLGLTPTSVLAGLFLYMGEQSLATNPILRRFLQILTPKEDQPEDLRPPPGVRYAAVHAYTLLEIVLTGIVFAITLTPAAPAFPLVIVIFVPIRLKIMTRMWSRETLTFVDAWACREEPLYADLDSSAQEGDEDRIGDDKVSADDEEARVGMDGSAQPLYADLETSAEEVDEDRIDDKEVAGGACRR